MKDLETEIMDLLVCRECGSPVDYDTKDECYRHQEPAFLTPAIFCDHYGYSVVPIVNQGWEDNYEWLKRT